ncbi:MAG: DUF480 domain-containing protein, partial [Mariprofundaceae bacterium]|nr:DUF480 domain-containing protein [Mariprofundaceae bacterium]
MTTPDYYPLTLKGLITACNQKNSRAPIMKLSDSEVAGVINALRGRGLITARMNGRTDRYEQHLSRALKLTMEGRAILCVLMLRGSLTLNEIRMNTGRMVEFPTQEALMDEIDKLTQGDDPLMVCIGRAHGQREDRYAHCLCGEVAVLSAASNEVESIPMSSSGDLQQRVKVLEQEVAQLRDELASLHQAVLGDAET